MNYAIGADNINTIPFLDTNRRRRTQEKVEFSRDGSLKNFS